MARMTLGEEMIDREWASLHGFRAAGDERPDPPGAVAVVVHPMKAPTALPAPAFDLHELNEVYGALEHWNPSNREDAAAGYRAFWKCGKAFGHPWALKFATADEAVAEYMKNWVAP